MLINSYLSFTIEIEVLQTNKVSEINLFKLTAAL